MPAINVRALAEFLNKPITDQMRILAEQKRPNAGAAAFKVHYYQTARAAISKYFASGNDPNRIHLATAKMLASEMADHKKSHNDRAMRSFLACNPFNTRNLTPQRSSTIAVTQHQTDVRLFADLTAVENGSVKYLLLNFSSSPLDAEQARQTLELMSWLLMQAQVPAQPTDCEIVDLACGQVHVNRKRIRSKTIKQAEQNLKAINQLWPII